MNASRKALKKTKVEIIPMIDTMFFLLIFFILQSLDIIKVKGINITLPVAAAESITPPKDLKDKPDEIVIAVSPKGQISVDQVPVEPEQIKAALQKNMEAQKVRKNLTKSVKDLMPEVTVIISADPAAKYDLMVRCIDESRNAGVVKFALASPSSGQ